MKMQYTHFLHSIQFLGYKIGIKFDGDPLVAEQNSFVAETVNACIAYELSTWPNNLLDNFTLKNCLFGASNILKNNGKNRWVFCGYEIAFDTKSL